MDVLVVNAGSSSLKLSLLDPADEIVAATEVEHWDTDGPRRRSGHSSPNARPGVGAVGHRIVHGGPVSTAPAVLDARRTGRPSRPSPTWRRCTSPGRWPASTQCPRCCPDMPAVACFDTAFHAGMPAAAATYALPAAWRERFGLRRYGFHGLSHSYASRRGAELLGRRPARLRMVTCHLGAGASLAAVQGGRSVDTTMGFTPLEGLVMATRAGNTDPGLLIWLLSDGRLSVTELAAGLEHAVRPGRPGRVGGHAGGAAVRGRR